MIAAGAAPTVTKVLPLLERLGQRLFLMGEDAGAANLMKLAGNVLTALTLEGMGEFIALLRKSGVDAHVAFDVPTGSLFDGKVHKTYGTSPRSSPGAQAIAGSVEAYSPWFQIRL